MLDLRWIWGILVCGCGFGCSRGGCWGAWRIGFVRRQADVRLRSWFLAQTARTASARDKWGFLVGRAFVKQWHGGARLILVQCLHRVHQAWCLPDLNACVVSTICIVAAWFGVMWRLDLFCRFHSII